MHNASSELFSHFFKLKAAEENRLGSHTDEHGIAWPCVEYIFDIVFGAGKIPAGVDVSRIFAAIEAIEAAPHSPKRRIVRLWTGIGQENKEFMQQLAHETQDYKRLSQHGPAPVVRISWMDFGPVKTPALADIASKALQDVLFSADERVDGEAFVRVTDPRGKVLYFSFESKSYIDHKIRPLERAL